MTTQEVKRKLVAILSADVKGYSRLMGEDEVATLKTLSAYFQIMTILIQKHQGRVLNIAGDNLLADFESVVDAVQCGVEIQKELRSKNDELVESRRVEFRIGVNLGDVIREGDTIYGDGVNIAERVQSLAERGGICISGTAYDQVENKLGIEYEYLGEQTVKNIAKPVRVYRVQMETKAVIQRGAEVASKEKMAFPLPDKPSIAVLPFVNMSDDPKQEYFCDGITDQIITSLSIVPRLFVIARNSTFVYKGKAVKVQKVAEEMGVRYVLEGSVQKSEGRVRILVQLIDAIKGIHLWSERYDRELKDLFILQDEIARQIMTALQVKLTEGEFASGVAGSTSNLKALECFWRAEEHYFHFAKESNAAARQWAQKAVELDPKFASAWALIGWTHLWDVMLLWSKSPPQSKEKALECAQKAIGLSDSRSPGYYTLMGYINIYNRAFDESIENGEKAVRINPNDPYAHTVLAGIMYFNGRFDEAIALYKTAMRLSPYYPASFLNGLSMCYFMAGRYEKALVAGELLLSRAQKGEFSLLMAHRRLVEAHIGLGQDQKARAHAEEILKIDPNYSLGQEKERIMSLFRDPSLSERIIDALRKAGLK